MLGFLVQFWVAGCPSTVAGNKGKRGLCYSIHSVETHPDTGSIIIYSGTSSEKISELSYVVAEEIKKQPVKDNEVSRTKIRMKAGLLMALEDPFNRCARMAGLLTTWGRI